MTKTTDRPGHFIWPSYPILLTVASFWSYKLVICCQSSLALSQFYWSARKRNALITANRLGMTWQWFVRWEAAAPGPVSPGGGRAASMTAPTSSATTTLWPTPWPTRGWWERTWAPSLCAKPPTQTPHPQCPRRFTSALTVSWSLI